MGPGDNPLTGCDQDIELNASCTGYSKYQANAMNSSSFICTKMNKDAYLRATKPRIVKMKIRIAMPNDWLKIPTLARLRCNRDEIMTELNISRIGCQGKEHEQIHSRISTAMLATIVEMAVTLGLGKMVRTNRICNMIMIIIHGGLMNGAVCPIMRQVNQLVVRSFKLGELTLDQKERRRKDDGLRR